MAKVKLGKWEIETQAWMQELGLPDSLEPASDKTATLMEVKKLFR